MADESRETAETDEALPNRLIPWRTAAWETAGRVLPWVIAGGFVLGYASNKLWPESLDSRIERNPSYITVSVNGLASGNPQIRKNWKIKVSAAEYVRYKGMTHSGGEEDFINFVEYDTPKMRALANDLTEGCDNNRAAHVILDFVHHHVSDASIERDREYIRYPLETIVDRNGDCEDLSILAAALMKARGLDVALVVFDDHAMIGVAGDFHGAGFDHNGKRYFCAETTGTEWIDKPSTSRIGWISEKYAGKEARVYVVE